MIEPQFDEVLDEQEKLASLADIKSATSVKGTNLFSLTPFRQILQRGGIRFLAAGNFNRDNAASKLESDDADVIVFGRWFISNPDLPSRLVEGLPFNPYDRPTFYGADPPSKGYVDYSLYTAPAAKIGA